MQRKTLDAPSSAILKLLLENHNYARVYSSEGFLIVGRLETFHVYVKEASLINKYIPTLNPEKEAYETLLFTQLGRGYIGEPTKLLLSCERR